MKDSEKSAPDNVSEIKRLVERPGKEEYYLEIAKAVARRGTCLRVGQLPAGGAGILPAKSPAPDL